MRARKIPREDLAKVTGEDWVDITRRPYVDGKTAWVPVRDGEPYDQEISPRPQYRGRGFYMAGDVVILHGDRPGADEIQTIVRRKKPRGIVWQKALSGVTRTPETEVVWGTCGDVRHRESGCTYILDPSKVMFSPGNRSEKARLAGLIRSGSGQERVADMFAGIGYFTIPMAAAGAPVYAIEINPVACEYLRRNAHENRLDGRITVIEGDCRERMEGMFDRIVMGHFDAIGMLPHALRHAEPGTTIHLHSIGSREEEADRIVRSAGFSCGIEVHTVKKYGPHAWHVVHDIRLI